jgi:hypothetical protein
MKSAASLFALGDGRFGLRCLYDADLVAGIKREVPKHFRSYDPERKVWTFDRSQLGLVRRLCVRYLSEVHVDPDLEARAAPPRLDPDLQLLGRLIAPLSDVGLKHVYKIVMGEVHPDAGGDTATAQEVNGVWAALAARRSARGARRTS